jgi:hypothetical protein
MKAKKFPFWTFSLNFDKEGDSAVSCSNLTVFYALDLFFNWSKN